MSLPMSQLLIFFIKFWAFSCSLSILYCSPPTPLFTSSFVPYSPHFLNQKNESVCAARHAAGGWPASKSRSPTADEHVATDWSTNWAMPMSVDRPSGPCSCHSPQIRNIWTKIGPFWGSQIRKNPDRHMGELPGVTPFTVWDIDQQWACLEISLCVFWSNILTIFTCWSCFTFALCVLLYDASNIIFQPSVKYAALSTR